MARTPRRHLHVVVDDTPGQRRLELAGGDFHIEARCRCLLRHHRPQTRPDGRSPGSSTPTTTVPAQQLRNAPTRHLGAAPRRTSRRGGQTHPGGAKTSLSCLLSSPGDDQWHQSAGDGRHHQLSATLQGSGELDCSCRRRPVVAWSRVRDQIRGAGGTPDA
jgi:hypothetical protein